MTLFYYGLVFRQQPLSELTYCMLLTKMGGVYVHHKKNNINCTGWLSLVVSLRRC
jgi:hypothetical protein